MHNWKRSHPCDVSAKGPIVAVKKGNQEGTDFGRECLMCKFHPETEGNGESFCPCQSWWAPQDLDNGLCLLIVLDFTVPVWICSMSVKGPRLSFTLHAKVKDLGTPARAFCSYKWSDTEAPSNRSCSTGSRIECSVPAFHRAACATMAHSTKRKYIICHPTLICFFS